MYFVTEVAHLTKNSEYSGIVGMHSTGSISNCFSTSIPKKERQLLTQKHSNIHAHAQNEHFTSEDQVVMSLQGHDCLLAMDYLEF